MLKLESPTYIIYMIESIKKNIVFVVGLLVIGGLGLFWFLRDTGQEDTSSLPGVAEQSSKYAAVRAEILGSIATLQAIHLDITVLDAPEFQALTEAPQPPEVPFVPKKRNPFVP